MLRWRSAAALATVALPALRKAQSLQIAHPLQWPAAKH